MTICGWCVCHGRKPTVLAEGPSNEPISHGICPTCAGTMLVDDAEVGWRMRVIRRIFTEFLEFPERLLSFQQIRSLLCVDEATCSQAMQCLVDAEFVRRIDLDTYARVR